MPKRHARSSVAGISGASGVREPGEAPDCDGGRDARRAPKSTALSPTPSRLECSVQAVGNVLERQAPTGAAELAGNSSIRFPTSPPERLRVLSLSVEAIARGDRTEGGGAVKIGLSLVALTVAAVLA